MPLRQTIGISLALLMASAGALASTPERSVAVHPAPPPNAEPGKSPNRGRVRASQRQVRFAAHPAQWLRDRRPAGDGDMVADNGFAEPHWGPMHAVGAPQIGEATWYDLVGRRTADGERLDTTTPTAAHRSLPLGSSARVTDLDTGQSIIVKINDRGPFNRRSIIDLSPAAASELGMRREGVAAVAVEPVATGTTDAVYRSAEDDTAP
jgi:rare lipoprotein A (peptidoglycan hydrolase)